MAQYNKKKQLIELIINENCAGTYIHCRRCSIKHLCDEHRVEKVEFNIKEAAMSVYSSKGYPVKDLVAGYLEKGL